MSKKYLTGSRRLQIIQRWLNGIDDPEYDVYPTRKEGKYIVKSRKSITTKDVNEESTDQIEQTENVLNTSPEQEESEQDDPYKEPIEEPKITPKKKQIPKQKAKQQANLYTPNPRSGLEPTHNQFYDPTINIEILNQLKLLGEEFKIKREKKEQKRMIKEAVQKQIAKPRMQYNYTEPDYMQQPNQNEEVIEQPQPQTIVTRRRNNIFADLM